MINKKERIKDLETTVAYLARSTNLLREDYIVLMNAYSYLAKRLDELCAIPDQEAK